MLQFAALKENVSAMTAKQEQMMRLQEVRQKQHQLEIHESKLQMLNASQNAVDFMSNVSGGGAADPQGQTMGNNSITNIESLKQTIQKAKANLNMEEENIRDSIETFEKEFNKSLNNNRSRLGSLEINMDDGQEESKDQRKAMNLTHASLDRGRSQDSGNKPKSVEKENVNQSQKSGNSKTSKKADPKEGAV